MALTHWEHAEEKVQRAASVLETQSLNPPSDRRPAPLKDAEQVTSLLRLNSYLFESRSSTCDGEGNAGLQYRSCCAKLRDPKGAGVGIATYWGAGGREETRLEKTEMVI